LKPLPYAIRADLFFQLSRLEAAGLPYARAVATMALPSPAAKRLKAMKALAARGIDAAKAGEQSGLFTTLEARLVRAALNAGTPAPMYKRLADYYAQRARQWAVMKSRLMMPAAVLVIALLVQPLPALVGGNISLKAYVWQATWPILVIAALVVVLRWMGSRGGIAKGKSLYQKVPFYGPIFVRSNLRDFFDSLSLMLEAGVPTLEALPAAIDTVSDGDIRRELLRVQQRVERQETFATALEGVSYLQGSRALPFAHTGEESGKLPEMLMRYAAMETEDIARFHEQMATWVPRVLYALVAVKVIWGIVTSGAFAPRVPKDL
jgi:type II secretory pathway component PulF